MTVSIPLFNERIKRLKKIKGKLVSLAGKRATPLYVYDSHEASTNIRRFMKAFRDAGVPISPFYALKSNPYLGLLKTVVKEKGDLDVSSIRELKIALKAKPRRLIFTGPGKTEADFREILKYSNKMTVHLESLHELRTLSAMALKAKKRIRCGVRVYTRQQAQWSKFGIPLSELTHFWREAKKCHGVKVCGVQFHISWNPGAARYIGALKELGRHIRRDFSATERKEIEFIDIGGGFLTEGFEAMYSWNQSQRIAFDYPKGFLEKLLADKVRPRYVAHHYEPIEKVARDIVRAWKKEILPLNPAIELCAEPGRFVCHSTMHHLLRVVDLKPERKSAIIDGGNNMVGWEKQQWVDYTPIFNLSRFETKKEFPYLLYGSLCTANDIWGYYLYGKGIERGDILVMPFQGAYTYTLAQNFIKSVPDVVDI